MTKEIFIYILNFSKKKFRGLGPLYYQHQWRIAWFFQSYKRHSTGRCLSPYLFVLAMEGLGLGGIIRQSIQNSTFKYHWRCKPTKITHLCFADDLTLFCHADLESIRVLKSSLDRFLKLSGLNINLAKSSLYMSGIDGRLRSSIVEMIGIQETSLPVRYLGVPLISSRLTHTYCIPLLESSCGHLRHSRMLAGCN
jgi:hypothetical protein